VEKPVAEDIPADPALRREWIKYQLAIRGWSLAGLARAHGVTRQQPEACLRRRYPKWEGIIAATLELTPEELWPERYEPGMS
jgi:Ner family transcriptional regulator